MNALLALLPALTLASSAAPLPQVVSEGAFGAAIEEARRTALAAVAAAGSQEDILLERTRDRDAGVRRAAARSLKGYSHLSERVRDRLQEMVKDGGEDFSVRYQAVKSLSPGATADGDTRDFLLGIARGRRLAELQSIACKALYWEAGRDEEVREGLLEVAERPGPGRRAALWALFGAAGDSEVRRALLGLAERGDALDRVEALKSLFEAMGHDEVRRLARKTAKDGSEHAELRRTGILMLVRRVDESDTRLLQDIARNDSDPRAREAALTVLSDPWSEVFYRHFHLPRRDRRYPYPIVHDPLDDE